MKLLVAHDYAIQTILYLGERNVTVSTKAIAEDLDLNRDFLIQVSQVLVGEGIITGVKGKNGGYKLVLAPDEINVLDVINAFKRSNIDRNGSDAVLVLKEAMENALDMSFAELSDRIARAIREGRQ